MFDLRSLNAECAENFLKFGIWDFIIVSIVFLCAHCDPTTPVELKPSKSMKNASSPGWPELVRNRYLCRP